MTTITVTLPAETEQKLRAKAGSAGLTLEGYLRQLAERDAANGTSPPPREPSFDAILAPVREGFSQSGMSEEELTALLKEEREAAWQVRQAGKPGK